MIMNKKTERKVKAEEEKNQRLGKYKAKQHRRRSFPVVQLFQRRSVVRMLSLLTATMLRSFDWHLANALMPETLDMEEKSNGLSFY